MGCIVDILVVLNLMWLADTYNIRLSVSGNDAFGMGDRNLYTWNGNIDNKGPAFVNCKVRAVLVVLLAWDLMC